MIVGPGSEEAIRKINKIIIRCIYSFSYVLLRAEQECRSNSYSASDAPDPRHVRRLHHKQGHPGHRQRRASGLSASATSPEQALLQDVYAAYETTTQSGQLLPYLDYADAHVDRDTVGAALQVGAGRARDRRRVSRAPGKQARASPPRWMEDQAVPCACAGAAASLCSDRAAIRHLVSRSVTCPSRPHSKAPPPPRPLRPRPRPPHLRRPRRGGCPHRHGQLLHGVRRVRVAHGPAARAVLRGGDASARRRREGLGEGRGGRGVGEVGGDGAFVAGAARWGRGLGLRGGCGGLMLGLRRLRGPWG